MTAGARMVQLGRHVGGDGCRRHTLGLDAVPADEHDDDERDDDEEADEGHRARLGRVDDEVGDEGEVPEAVDQHAEEQAPAAAADEIEEVAGHDGGADLQERLRPLGEEVRRMGQPEDDGRPERDLAPVKPLDRSMVTPMPRNIISSAKPTHSTEKTSSATNVAPLLARPE